ncbi:OLC1v1020286C1 [Oldenlandia corymbosa var. corymbosa]|uniref:OLC1v1020286C1 n=1 Tax=Oldenlandia corymbosa var. corymbosa TaxID=529605 RepID=A0AAV1EGK6_OLDCO|nr:OLC1v1020286C1 [Oldenlandia corymbosa var. corymbosa]
MPTSGYLDKMMSIFSCIVRKKRSTVSGTQNPEPNLNSFMEQSNNSRHKIADQNVANNTAIVTDHQDENRESGHIKSSAQPNNIDHQGDDGNSGSSSIISNNVTPGEPSNQEIPKNGKRKANQAISPKPPGSITRARYEVGSQAANIITRLEKDDGKSEQKEKAKESNTISEHKTRKNPELQEQGKGKKAESSNRTTHPPTKTPSKSNEHNSGVESPEPVYYITWNGYEDECEAVSGEICSLCQRDISSSDSGTEGSQVPGDEYGFFFEHMSLRPVGVLACGHFFHVQCLESITPDDQLTDPPCFLCLSLSCS